jgi:hypothetical protein
LRAREGRSRFAPDLGFALKQLQRLFERCDHRNVQCIGGGFETFLGPFRALEIDLLGTLDRGSAPAPAVIRLEHMAAVTFTPSLRSGQRRQTAELFLQEPKVFANAISHGACFS